MPELPEVETIKIQLTKYLVGHKILDLEIITPKVFSGDAKKVRDARIVGVRRFAKVISIDLDNGYSLLMHVKLTGQPIYRGSKLKSIPLSKKILGGLPGKHTHLIFKLDKGGFFYYNDVRKFGWIKVVKKDEVEKTDFIKKLGPEPFNGLTLAKFKKILSSSSQIIKVLLMNQSKIGGIGNIYANDSLWLAKINPKIPANKLSPSQQEALYKAVIKALKEGIKRGGASDVSFVTPEGKEGKYQEHFLVYSRKDEPCLRCKKKIQKISLGGRGTYYCPLCQK